MKYNSKVAFILGCVFTICLMVIGVGLSYLFVSFIFWDLSFDNWSWVGKTIYFILCFGNGYFSADYFNRMRKQVKKL